VNSRAELPPDPSTATRDSDKGPMSVSAAIQNPPRIPVLADGLFVHTARSTDPFETDIQLPNISCEKCTLQIVEFMAEHGYNNPAAISTITAPTCKLPPIPRRRSTLAGQRRRSNKAAIFSPFPTATCAGVS